MNDFFNEEIPSTPSRYTKIKENETRKLRILSSPTPMWEYWTLDNKPVRVPVVKWIDAPKSPRPDRKTRYTWALTVYNYDTNQVELWQCGQRQIIDSLLGYAQDPDFWSPLDYDIKVTRTWKDLETKYSVKALQKQSIAEDINMIVKTSHVNHRALFFSADPFDTNWDETFEIEQI